MQKHHKETIDDVKAYWDSAKKHYIQQSMRNVPQYSMQSNQYGRVCIVVLMQISLVYINNQTPIYISNNCWIVITYISILQHQPQTMTMMDSKSKKNIYLSFGQILDKVSLATRNIAKSNKACTNFQR